MDGVEWLIPTPNERAGTRKENEIWICTQASSSYYLRKAISLLEVKGYSEIVIKGMGRAVRKASEIAESVKKSVDGLHESTYVDPAHPVSNVTITLSKKGLSDGKMDSDCEGLGKRTHGKTGTRKENELWISTRKSICDYVRDAIVLLEVKGYDKIVLTAMGRAVLNASEIAESVKRSIAGLDERTCMDPANPLAVTITLSKKGLTDASKDSDHEGLSKRTDGGAGTRKENEIWISARAIPYHSVRNATTLLEEKGYNEIVLKAMGSAIQNALETAEEIKRSISGLLQTTYTDCSGRVSNVTITLSKRALNASSRGYQCSESGNGIGSSRDAPSGYRNLACDGGSGKKKSKVGSILSLKNNVSMKEREEAEDCFILDFNPFEPCLKNNVPKKETEEVEDCSILESNPFEPVDRSKKLFQNDHHKDDEQDLFVIAERGQVACRDYPHSRHLCVKFPFDKTPHKSHCEQCYCYVCDVIAPCNFWTQPERGHCHATDQDFMWKIMRTSKAQFAKTTTGTTETIASPFQQPLHLHLSNHHSIITETAATTGSPFQQRSLRLQEPSHIPYSNRHSRHPTVNWAQRSDKVFITIELPDAKDVMLKLEPEGKFFFSATSGADNIPYEVDIDLYDKVDVNESKVSVGLRNRCYLLKKVEKKWWSRLIKQHGKPPLYLKVDWDKWVDEDEEQEESFGDDVDFADNVNFGDQDFSELNMGGPEDFDYW